MELQKKTNKPGYNWRININVDGCFDELVIDQWFHLEQMDTRFYSLNLGDRIFYIHINKDNVVITE